VHRLAEPHGVPGVLVDGNDAPAVREAAAAAVSRARRRGPTLLECATYRWSGHYVGDPERYRSPEELAGWRARDPLARLAPVIGAERAAAIDADVAAALDAAAQRALAAPVAGPEALLEHVWS
jgi:TPP-dependent pyruvate/acetoin dehydrogenase alpha subunit